MKALLCEFLLSCVLGTSPAPAVEDLDYGTVLYHYYQERNADALLATMVAERRGRFGEDAVRWQLAQGSLAFADGMFRLSSDLFAAVPAAELGAPDRARLAFHLAREYHRRGDWSSLEAELALLEPGRLDLEEPPSHPELDFMRTELALAGGDLARARTVVATFAAAEPLRAYALYNLGVAERAAGNAVDARAAFAALAAMPARDVETVDLVQRAMLAVAHLDRAAGRHADARAVLAAVPSSGRYRDPALASWGTTAMANGDWELAARIWLTLKDQDHWTVSTAQARLGFPLSLDRMEARDSALARYREAAASFEARLDRLAILRAETADTQRVRALLEAFATGPTARSAAHDDGETARAVPAVAEDPNAALLDSWRTRLGHTDWLEWLASEPVHRLLSQWRELGASLAWLDTLPGDLHAWAEVADEQTRRGAVARRLLIDDGLLQRRDAVAERVAQLGAELVALGAANAPEDSEGLLVLATADERRLIERIVSLRERVAASPEAEQPALRARVDRLTGLVSFEQARDRAARLRATATQLAELKVLLADIDGRADRLERAEATYTASVAADFEAFRVRAAAIRTDVARHLERREELIAQELRAGIDREREEVDRYLLTARIAIARATDQLADAGAHE